MKAIMMSIRPQWVAKILNKVKTIEVRKHFPSDYVGWVYIYVTQGNALFDLRNESVDVDFGFVINPKSGKVRKSYNIGDYGIPPILNGKVAARFWCDKVEEITTREDRFKEFMFYETSLDTEDLCKQSCLDYKELDNYLQGEKGKAIHITKLDIFIPKPKEISEFKVRRNDCPFPCAACNVRYCQLKRPPQSWQFIEV